MPTPQWGGDHYECVNCFHGLNPCHPEFRTLSLVIAPQVFLHLVELSHSS